MKARLLESEDMHDSWLILISENENSSVVTCFDHLTISFFLHILAIVMSQYQSSSFIVNEEFLSGYIYTNNLMVCLMAIFDDFMTELINFFLFIIFKHILELLFIKLL
jgi:hypothetical protein